MGFKLKAADKKRPSKLKDGEYYQYQGAREACACAPSRAMRGGLRLPGTRRWQQELAVIMEAGEKRSLTLTISGSRPDFRGNVSGGLETRGCGIGFA